MSVEAHIRNPFMLLLNPEGVIAAMEASERLKQLNRHECRPLDRVVPTADEESSPESQELLL